MNEGDRLRRSTRVTANQMIDAVYTDGHIFICWQTHSLRTDVSPSSSVQQRFRESLSGKLDRQMQELIVGESNFGESQEAHLSHTAGRRAVGFSGEAVFRGKF